MKKLFLILTILFVSVLTTACINNFAIQELNNKAKEYLNSGEVDKAICRYKSSLDLDSGILETNYNLGIAYIAAKNYEEALDALKAALKINPEFFDAYYSIAVALENTAYDRINGVKPKNVDCENGQTITIDAQTEEIKPVKLSENDKLEISKLFMDAIDNYNHYLSLNPTAEDKDNVAAKVEELNTELVKYTPRNLNKKNEG